LNLRSPAAGRLAAVALACLAALAAAPSVYHVGIGSWRPAATSVGATIESPSSSPAAIVPDPTLTPGAVRTTDAGEICASGTRAMRHWSRERDDRIMAEYGLPPGPHPDYEIDHLIPFGIGGSDDDRNLWPEPRRSIEPTWNAERKDDLEWRLRGSRLLPRARHQGSPASHCGGLDGSLSTIGERTIERPKVLSTLRARQRDLRQGRQAGSSRYGDAHGVGSGFRLEERAFNSGARADAPHRPD
jgi:hypothetical protein